MRMLLGRARLAEDCCSMALTKTKTPEGVLNLVSLQPSLKEHID